MSEDKAGMHRHPLQNAQRSSLDSASQYYHGNLVGSMGANTASTGAGDSDFDYGDFELPYGVSDQAVIGPPIDNPQAASILQHRAIGSGMVPESPSQIMNPIIPLTCVPGKAEIDPQAMPIDNADDANREKTTPSSNAMDDSITSDFALSTQGIMDGIDPADGFKDGKDGGTPAWSELKTKAGKDRKRLPLACIACRRKKIRCSGEKPACKHCMRSRIPCVYKVTTRKAAPRTDYMAMLDKRMKRMEERIIKILPKNEQGSISAIPRAVVKPPLPGIGSPVATKSTHKKRSADDAFGPDLEAWAKTPQAPMADKEPESPDSQEAAENQLLQEGIESLPPKDIQEHLAEVFFDYVYGQAYLLLHKPSYMRKLRNDTLPPVLILSVCAIAARFTPNPKLTSTAKQFMRGEEWASVARDICTKRYDWPNITILTCLLILGIHEFGTCHGGRAWALGGQAIRMAFALHLHKDLEYDPLARSDRRKKLSFIDREIRRRTMWACFIMDRFNSSGTDRPIFIKEETMKIPLPVAENYFQLDMPVQTECLDGSVPAREVSEDFQLKAPKECMGVSAYIIRAISIWGRIITYINQGGRDVDSHPMWSPDSEFSRLIRETQELLRTLPEALRYNRRNIEIQRTEKLASHLLFLHMSIQQNLLFLNQAAVTFSQDRFDERAPKEFVLQSSANTFFAANQISAILRHAEETQCNISTPFAGYCAFSSTAIHITGLFSGNSEMKAASEANAGVNVKFLRRMMNYWGMFHWMVENIRTQYRNALDATKSGGPALGNMTSSPILQYSDWFNRYPHGFSDPDYMDPAIYRKKEKGEDGVLEQKSELQSVGDFFTAVGPTQNVEGKDGSRSGSMQKRKASRKQTSTPSDKADLQRRTKSISEASDPSAVSAAHSAAMQPHHQPPPPPLSQSPQQPLHRQGSGSLSHLGRHSSGGSEIAYPLNPNLGSMGQLQSQTLAHDPSPTMSFTSDNTQPFGQSMMTQPEFFSTDMLSMNLGRPPDSLLQSLDRQFAYGGFSLNPDMTTSAPGGYGGWSDLSTTQSNQQQQPQQNAQLNGLATVKDNEGSQYGDAMHHLSNAQDVAAGWYVPSFTGSQDMSMGSGGGGGEMNPFGNLFGGPSDMAPNNQNGDM